MMCDSAWPADAHFSKRQSAEVRGWYSLDLATASSFERSADLCLLTHVEISHTLLVAQVCFASAAVKRPVRVIYRKRSCAGQWLTGVI